MKSNIILWLIIIVLLLAGLNYYQYTNCNRTPIVQTDTVTHIVTVRDTVYEKVTQVIVKEKPMPVLVHDTIIIAADYRLREYADTVTHEYGRIFRREWVAGELLRKEIGFDFDIPTYYETTYITHTVTNTVQDPVLFATLSFRSGWGGHTAPQIGAVYVMKGHRFMGGIDLGLDRSLTIKAGINIQRTGRGW